MKLLKYIFRLFEDFILWIFLSVFGRNITLSESWNSLNELQLREIAAALEHYHNFTPLFPGDARPALYSKLYVQLVKSLLRVNSMFKVWYALRQIPPDFYKTYIQFLIDDVSRTVFLPAFKIKKTLYYPPADRVQNLSINEFSFVDSMYYNWRKSGNEGFLDLLCAALYRKKSKEAEEIDPRVPFSKILVHRDAAIFKKINRKKKLAIAYCYLGSRNYLVKQFPHVFPAPEKEEGETKKPQPKAQYVTFIQLLQHKMKFDISKLEGAQRVNIYDFLNTYENELKEIKNQPVK